MNAFILGLKHDIEQLKDGRINLLLKSSNQELIIDRLKSDVERSRTDKKKCEDLIQRGHQKEVTLTAERDTLKRELEIIKETSKRELDLMRTLLSESKSEMTQLRAHVDSERVKRQKMRSSYRKLNESLQDDTASADVRIALDQLREGLME